VAVGLGDRARIETLSADCDGVMSLPPSSPDAIVLDVKGVERVDEIVGKLGSHFPLSPIIATNVKTMSRRPWPGVDGSVVCAVVPRPATIQELLEAIRRELRPSLRPLPRFSAEVVGVLHYVSEHYARLPPRGVRSVLGDSSHGTSRAFRAEMGITIKTYLTRVRLEAARQLLARTTNKLEAVAAMAGFHDASHLSRLFVKYLGMRPGDVRRTAR
jgi:AraC-like DNA-binding protein